MLPRRDAPTNSRTSAIRLVVIALVLLGVWFLRTRDASPPLVTGTAPRADAAPRAGDADRPAADAARREPAGAAADASSGERYDLEAGETRGGHTLARHVGRTDAQLRERLVSEPGISSASTYTTRALAERTVARTLRDNADRVRTWMARRGNRPNLALDYRGPRGDVLGRNIRRGQEAVECTNAILVLRWSGRDYYVLTSYPEPSH
jgi:hypothetical protein